MTSKSSIIGAIKTRFRGHGTLRRLGRVIVAGDEGHEHSAFTLVNLSMDETLDTFNSDIEVWSVVMTFGSKSDQPDDASEWMEAIVDAFEDAVLIWPSFDTVGCRVLTQDGPTRTDTLFTANSLVELTIQRLVNKPKTRNAVTT